MIYIIIILSVLLIASLYVIYNLFRKVEVLETLAEKHSDYLVRLNDMVSVSTKRSREQISRLLALGLRSRDRHRRDGIARRRGHRRLHLAARRGR